jgi:hypothetical protein
MMNKYLLAAVMMCGVALGGETLGLWVFNGTAGEECADGTVIHNLVENSPLTLIASTTNLAGKTVHQPKYVDDVPNGALYSNEKYTNRLAVLNTSIHVCTGSASNVGGYLRVKDFGAAVMENGVAQDFTIEMLVRPRTSAKLLGLSTYGNNNTLFCGIEGKDNAHSPSFAHGEYNAAGGCIRAMTNSFSNVGNVGGNGICYNWIFANLYNDEWHHWCLTYSASTGQATVRLDWGKPSQSVSSVKWLVEGGIPLVDDSCFQILGRLGQVANSFYGASVAAVRISKGILSEADYMRGGKNYDVDPVMAWWRFENGAPGQAYKDCSSEVPIGVDGKRKAQKSNYGSTGYAVPPKAYVREGADVGNKYHRNNVCLWGNGNVSDATGIGVYATAPEFLLPGSFTAEGFYFLTSNATTRVGSDGNARQPLMNEQYNSSTIAWGVRTDSSRLNFFCCKVTNLVTGAMSAWTSNAYWTAFPTGVWHHVAVVYDDDARPRTLSLYVDYAHKTSFTISDTEKLVRMGNATFFLCGAHVNNANTSWFGGFDEFRFSHKALAPEEFLVRTSGQGFLLQFK